MINNGFQTTRVVVILDELILKDEDRDDVYPKVPDTQESYPDDAKVVDMLWDASQPFRFGFVIESAGFPQADLRDLPSREGLSPRLWDQAKAYWDDDQRRKVDTPYL